MNVEKQKRITDFVLGRIYPISQSAIVAGGAPRDWYFGRSANDIDIYFYRPDLETSLAVCSTFYRVGFTIRQIGAEFTNHPLYEKNAMIERVFDCEFSGLKFQFIQMNQKTFTSVVKNFPLNICMIWYKNGKINGTPDFFRAVRHNAIVKVNPLYANSDAYIKKICNRFPDYKYYENYEELAKSLLDG